MRMRLSFCILLVVVTTTPSVIRGAQSSRIAFHGVIAGVTTEAELRRNKQWGQGRPLKITPGPDLSNVLEYRFGIWQRILVAISNKHVVSTIDVTPPARSRAEELAKVLELGDLVPENLNTPLSPPVYDPDFEDEHWQRFRCTDGSVMLLVEETGGKRYARLMRFYSPPSADAKDGLKLTDDQGVMNEQPEILADGGVHDAMFRGQVWLLIGSYDNAIASFSKAIRLDPKNAFCYVNRGRAWDGKGDYVKAISDYTAGIRLNPKDPEGYNYRGWLRATCEDSQYRDAKQAIADANTACTLSEWKEPRYIDTLAAAYAEAGEFEKAVEWQAKAVEIAPESEKSLYHKNLDLYRAGKPYRNLTPGDRRYARPE